MKKLLSILLVGAMLLGLAACGDSGTGGGKLPLPNTTGDDSALANDFQKHSDGGFYEDFNRVCETESGYYFTQSQFLQYMDKETKAITPLCTKPNCKHNYDDAKICTAYVGSTNLLTYYDGKLYFCNSWSEAENLKSDRVTRLFSINLDGTGLTEVQDLEHKPVENSDQDRLRAYIIHRGIVYFSLSGEVYAVKLGNKIDDAVKIVGTHVEGQTGAIQTFSPYQSSWSLWADGDDIYMMQNNAVKEDKTYTQILYRYNAVSQKTEQVWQTPDKAEVGAWETTGVSVTDWYITGGYIYFYLSGNDVWRTDLASGKAERVAKVSEKAEMGEAFFTDQFIYILKQHSPNRTNVVGGAPEHLGGEALLVYGLDGSFIKEISFQKFIEKFDSFNKSEFAWAAPDGVFLTSQIYHRNAGADESYGWTNVLSFVNADDGSVTEIPGYPGAKRRN